jgi:poly-gamma-glutamate synthesis protein (capsule biosynthesis protein)
MNMRRIIKILIVLGAAILIFVGLYFASSISNSFLIGSGVVSRPYVVRTSEDTAGDLQMEKDTDKIVLTAVGDIMLSRNVEQQMIAKNDWNYPFEKMAAITSGADLTFGNLETTITAGDIVKSGSFTFRTDPKAVAGLEYAGFDVLSLANNHMMNFGRRGLESTLKELDAAGIAHAGAGLSAAGISKPAVREVKGVKFGFLAYSYADEQSRDKAGELYGTDYMDTSAMQADVAALKPQVDVVVVSMHAGTEYATAPSVAQTSFAHAAVDAGASLVIGHHPHVVETAEKYKDGYIIYSLGNFVFDQMWSEETRLGAVADITFDKNKISKIDFIPVKIYDYAQPQLAEGADREKIMARLKLGS